MMLFNGFLATIGAICAIFCFFILMMALIRSRKKPEKATAKDWRAYLKEVISNNEFTEAATLTPLLANRVDDDQIDTPKGYKVDVQKSIVIDEGEEDDGISKIRVLKTFKIIKLQNNKSA